MTVADAVERYGISERTIRRWIAEGKLLCHNGRVSAHGMYQLAQQWRTKTRARPKPLLLV